MQNFMRAPRFLGLAAVTVCLSTPAMLDARIKTITISSKGAAFDNQSFGSTGRYEQIRGVAFGEIDPKDRRNSLITDIGLARRNARGLVEYRTTFTMLKPVDMSKSPGVLFYNVVNRGRYSAFGGGEPGDGFLYKLGQVVLCSGWQGDLPIASGQPEPGRHRCTRREKSRRIAGDRSGVGPVRQR